MPALQPERNDCVGIYCNRRAACGKWCDGVIWCESYRRLREADTISQNRKYGFAVYKMNKNVLETA